MITEQQINLLRDVIVETMHPKKIYLFGSYANGVPNEESDLDILIEIENTTLKSSKRNIEVWTQMDKYNELDFSKDIFVYTALEVKKFSVDKYSFLSMALENCKVIYEFH